MTRVGAYHKKLAATANMFAVHADFFYRCFYLHDCCTIVASLYARAPRRDQGEAARDHQPKL